MSSTTPAREPSFDERSIRGFARKIRKQAEKDPAWGRLYVEALRTANAIKRADLADLRAAEDANRPEVDLKELFGL